MNQTDLFVLAELDTMLSVGRTPRQHNPKHVSSVHHGRATLLRHPRPPPVPTSLDFLRTTQRSHTPPNYHPEQPPVVPFRRFTALQNRRLPREVLFRVLAFLDPVSLTRLSSTNKRFLEICRNETLWSALRIVVCFRGNARAARLFDENNPAPSPPHNRYRFEVISHLNRDRADVLTELAQSESALRDVEERVRVRQLQLADRWQSPHAAVREERPPNTFRASLPTTRQQDNITTPTLQPTHTDFKKLADELSQFRHKFRNELNTLSEAVGSLQSQRNFNNNLFTNFERKVCQHILASTNGSLPQSVQYDTKTFFQRVTFQQTFPLGLEYFELKNNQTQNAHNSTLLRLIKYTNEMGITQSGVV